MITRRPFLSLNSRMGILVEVADFPPCAKIAIGKAAQTSADLVERARLARQAMREAQQSALVRLAAADQILQDLRAVTDLVLKSTLLLLGFHDHRGTWRRRRERREQD